MTSFIPRLDVHGETPMTVAPSGTPTPAAKKARLGALAGCRDAEHGAGDLDWRQRTVRLILVDVDDATVVFEIWSRVDFDAWLPTAQGVVDSIGFLDVPPRESAPPSSSVSP